MSQQLSLLDADPAENRFGLTTPGHINHEITGVPGLQDVGTIPGLKFLEGFLTPDEQSLLRNARGCCSR